MNDCNRAVNKVYDERKDFILIGLTGRTGSGCSTVSKILGEKEFSKLNLRTPKSYDFKNSEERKYSILYGYAETCNWGPFQVISISDIITSFIIEQGYDALKGYIEKLSSPPKKEIVIHDKEVLLKELENLKGDMDKIKNLIIDEDTRESIITPVVYQENVHELANKLKEILKRSNVESEEKQLQLYTFLYQRIGKNLRSSGNPFNEEFLQDKFFTVAERTNALIKEMRNANKREKKPTLICIDAIRNPFEASFFKDRYSAFYLMSVNTDDLSRRKRLDFLKSDEINSLDGIEYPKKLDKKEKFYNQNIGACLEIADIHIYNPDIDNNKHYFLTEQLLKYVMLMIHPGLITPTHIERCMQVAYNAKLNSGCLSRQVGAVVTDNEYSIKSIGWNEVPRGQVSCSLRDVREYCKNKDRETYSNYEITNYKFSVAMEDLCGKIKDDDLKGRKYPYCFKDVYNKLENKNNQVYTRALHAEENAFLQISRNGGVGVNGGFLFSTASPCELCSKKSYHLGIKRIYYIDPYPGISQSHILQFGSLDNPELNLFYGAIGNAYINLYTPRMPYKDELEMLTGWKTKEKIESIEKE
ncbi:dCMP deaminase [Clostridium algidicarnis]|uniref:dCMP deaminase n=1 Tax=Clostridium algidicarnis TaxID=37659 RepID=A0ABS6C692_9CLOT|nr:dCMP deaminase [Clostridium algidicarnis]MBU3221029.1 dCMP deaminase [Clostridium algidicarnis]